MNEFYLALNDNSGHLADHYGHLWCTSWLGEGRLVKTLDETACNVRELRQVLDEDDLASKPDTTSKDTNEVA